MHWIITKVSDDDLKSRIGLGRMPDGPNSRLYVNHMSKLDPTKGNDPSVLTALIEGFTRNMTHEFRLLDDDKNVCFEGMCKDPDQATSGQAFEPLDFAAADVGATTMQIRRVGESEWKDL